MGSLSGRFSGFLFALAATAAMGAAVAAESPRRAPRSDATDRIIVKLRADARVQSSGAIDPRARIASIASRTGLSLGLARSVTDQLHSVQLERALAGNALAERVALLARDPAVEYAEADRRKYPLAIPNDTLYGITPVTHQWYLTPPSVTLPAAINAERAWDITVGSANAVVAVLDTGVRFDHPDLGSVGQGGKLLPGYDFIHEDSAGVFLTANDGDARDADPSDPGDWIEAADQANPLFPAAQCPIADSSWHGTHIAALIGARTNNGVGVAGIGWDTPVLPVRVLGKCAGYTSDILAAMRWAGGLPVPGVPNNPNPARILNLSLGSDDPCGASYQTEVNALRAVGVLIVAAAGNATGPVGEPANCSGVIAVAAIRHVGTKVGFSSFGPEVAISAPGGNCVNPSGSCLYPIISADNAGTKGPQAGNGNIYGGKLGTSFSTPMVAGVAALMLARNPNLTVDQLRDRLRSTARPFPPSDPTLLSCSDPNFRADASGNFPNAGSCNCTTSTCGAGMLDAHRAVFSATNVVAIASGPASTVTGVAITLSGSASFAGPGATINSFVWTSESGPATPTLGNANTSQLTFSAGTVGTYVVRLTVGDTAGTSDSVLVSIAVDAPPPPPPSGGGGGGSLPWTQLLLIAVLSLAGRSRRAH